MTAVAAPVVLPAPLPAGPQAEARKRRREILASQRSHALTTSAAELDLSNAHQTACAILPAIEIAMAAPASKRQKTEVAAKSKKSGKKPQMKYDPDVPMTKEEATAWRREQRRKRNRESAAASRQRQRDRINELEGEVEEWKSKYEAIMASIAKLEQQKAEGTADAVLTHLPPLPETTVSKFVSPPASPGHSPSYEPSEPVASPIASSSLIPPPMVSPQELSASKGIVKMEACEPSDNLISRPAASRIIHNLIFDNFFD